MMKFLFYISLLIFWNPLFSQNKDSASIYFSHDTVYYSANGKLINRSYISPPKNLGKGSESGPLIKSDEAFLAANCLIILREEVSLGNFCHWPRVKKVEIYTTQSDTIFISNKRKSLNKNELTSAFEGRVLNEPNSNWAIITSEMEGCLYGYIFIKSDGTYKEFKIPTECCNIKTEDGKFINGEVIYNARKNIKDKCSWMRIKNNGQFVFGE